MLFWKKIPEILVRCGFDFLFVWFVSIAPPWKNITPTGWAVLGGTMIVLGWAVAIGFILADVDFQKKVE